MSGKFCRQSQPLDLGTLDRHPPVLSSVLRSIHLFRQISTLQLGSRSDYLASTPAKPEEGTETLRELPTNLQASSVSTIYSDQKRGAADLKLAIEESMHLYTPQVCSSHLQQPAFGASSSAFGTPQSTPAFGSQPFGSSSAPASFGGGSNAFGASSSPAFGGMFNSSFGSSGFNSGVP